MVERVSREIRTEAPTAASLQIAEEEMTFPVRCDLEKLKAMGTPPTYYQGLTTGRPIGFPPARLRVPVTTLLVNRGLASSPCPASRVDLQIDLRERMPDVTTVLLGYANGYVGYLPTMRAASRDGVYYGANAWPTLVEVGAPERMLDRGIIRILEFLGKLKPREEKGVEPDSN